MLTLQSKPESWLCLATSFAMALGITTNEFCDIAGHDGGDIVNPDLPDPWCRRGFHIMEAVFVALHCGYAATPVQVMPVIASTPVPGTSNKEVIVAYNHRDTGDGIEDNWRFFQQFIATRKGVIECRTQRGNHHAVAFQADMIFDPDGREFNYSREACESRGLFTHCLWLIDRLA